MAWRRKGFNSPRVHQRRFIASLKAANSIWWTVPDSNRRSPQCECGALPTVLTARTSLYQNIYESLLKLLSIRFLENQISKAKLKTFSPIVTRNLEIVKENINYQENLVGASLDNSSGARPAEASICKYLSNAPISFQLVCIKTISP